MACRDKSTLSVEEILFPQVWRTYPMLDCTPMDTFPPIINWAAPGVSDAGWPSLFTVSYLQRRDGAHAANAVPRYSKLLEVNLGRDQHPPGIAGLAGNHPEGPVGNCRIRHAGVHVIEQVLEFATELEIS